ncbi:undecaprenyl-diphosphate phosphatase [bacterium]|nr:undecaprenyl-diphosphate phosphatase [bacterium]
MLNLVYSLLLGLVQGVTEFLPVSSSGHLTILQHLFKSFKGDLFFDLILHMGTLLAVFIFFWKEIIDLLKMLTKPLAKSSRLLHYLILSTIITVGFVLPFNHRIESFFNAKTLVFVGIALIFTGIINIFSQKMIIKRLKKEGGWFDAVLIGFFQFIATVPGISRSGSTIFASLLTKNSPKFSFNYSFLLSIPAILGAFALETKKLLNGNIHSNITFIEAGLGFIAAFISGYFALKILKKLIMSKHYYVFGIYVIVIGTGVILFSL